MVGRIFTDFLTSPSRSCNAGVMYAIIVFITIKIRGHADLEEESDFSQRRVMMDMMHQQNRSVK